MFILNYVQYRRGEFLRRIGLYIRDINNTVSVFIYNDDTVAIKRIDGDIPSARYEYMVGKEIYDRSIRLDPIYHVITKTIDLLVYEGISFLVMEYIPGVSVYSVINRRKDLIHKYIRMIRIIHDLQDMIRFTHYDLHIGNIITDDDLSTFKIIDFEYSHVDGITGWVRTSIPIIAIGGISSVYDSWFDIVRLVLLPYSIISYNPSIDILGILRNNNFSPFIGVER